MNTGFIKQLNIQMDKDITSRRKSNESNLRRLDLDKVKKDDVQYYFPHKFTARQISNPDVVQSSRYIQEHQVLSFSYLKAFTYILETEEIMPRETPRDISIRKQKILRYDSNFSPSKSQFSTSRRIIQSYENIKQSALKQQKELYFSRQDNIEENSQRVKLILQIKSLKDYYEQFPKINVKTSLKVRKIISDLMKQKSNFGEEINIFYKIILDMIFCQDQEFVDIIKEGKSFIKKKDIIYQLENNSNIDIYPFFGCIEWIKKQSSLVQKQKKEQEAIIKGIRSSYDKQIAKQQELIEELSIQLKRQIKNQNDNQEILDARIEHLQKQYNDKSLLSELYSDQMRLKQQELDAKRKKCQNYKQHYYTTKESLNSIQTQFQELQIQEQQLHIQLSEIENQKDNIQKKNEQYLSQIDLLEKCISEKDQEIEKLKKHVQHHHHNHHHNHTNHSNEDSFSKCDSEEDQDEVNPLGNHDKKNSIKRNSQLKPKQNLQRRRSSVKLDQNQLNQVQQQVKPKRRDSLAINSASLIKNNFGQNKPN